MSDLNKRLSEWNETISEGERLRRQARESAMKMRDGLPRRVMLWLVRFSDKWVKRGKRWRDEEMRDE